MNTILQVLLLTLVLMAMGCVSTRPNESRSEKLSPDWEDKFFDLGQGQVHFRVIRGVAPTILLESGGGEDTAQWASLQPEIARVTRLAVVSYDRPGFGASDLPSAPYEPGQEMRQLKQGLKRLGLDREMILVGHSYGALLNQLYASQNPKTIRGVVLIDPNTMEFMDSIGGFQELIKDFRYDGPQPPSKRIQAILRQVPNAESFRLASFPEAIPMVVITAGKPWWPTEERNRLFRTAHEKVVADNPNRSLVVAEGSGHNVTADRPDMVLAAIKDVVARIHLKSSPNPARQRPR